jgi:hypothetical protein
MRRLSGGLHRSLFVLDFFKRPLESRETGIHIAKADSSGDKLISDYSKTDTLDDATQLAQRLKYDVAAYVPCTLQRDT